MDRHLDECCASRRWIQRPSSSSSKLISFPFVALIEVSLIDQLFHSCMDRPLRSGCGQVVHCPSISCQHVVEVRPENRSHNQDPLNPLQVFPRRPNPFSPFHPLRHPHLLRHPDLSWAGTSLSKAALRKQQQQHPVHPTSKGHREAEKDRLVSPVRPNPRLSRGRRGERRGRGGGGEKGEEEEVGEGKERWV